MFDYKNLLILTYFFQKKEMYIFSEIQGLLGLCLDQFDARIDLLLNGGLLACNDNLLTITNKGLEIVLAHNIESFPFFYENDKKCDQNIIEFVTQIGINDIYIPKDFDKKV